MKLTWIGHSCFSLESEGHRLVFDPYEPGHIPGCRDVHEVADVVICSHDHYDHNYVDGVKIKEEADQEYFMISSFSVAHDPEGGRLRGMTDINIVEAEGLRIAHMGDIGCRLSKEQKDQLKELDILMIPVGGVYTIDGRQAAEIVHELKPVFAIPMHYSGEGFGIAAIHTVDEFVCGFYQTDVFFLESSSLEITEKRKSYTKVLIPKFPY